MRLAALCGAAGVALAAMASAASAAESFETRFAALAHRNLVHLETSPDAPAAPNPSPETSDRSGLPSRVDLSQLAEHVRAALRRQARHLAPCRWESGSVRAIADLALLPHGRVEGLRVQLRPYDPERRHCLERGLLKMRFPGFRGGTDSVSVEVANVSVALQL